MERTKSRSLVVEDNPEGAPAGCFVLSIAVQCLSRRLCGGMDDLSWMCGPFRQLENEIVAGPIDF